MSPPLVRAQSADTVPSDEGEQRPLNSSGVQHAIHTSAPHSTIDIEAQRSAEQQQEGLAQTPGKESQKPIGRGSVNVASIIR